MITIATIGNVNDINTFSGTPYHFLKSAQRLGLAETGWELSLNPLKIPRILWNLGQSFYGNRPGGFQYSSVFRKALIKQIPESQRNSDVITFNQHFPLKKDLSGKSKLYIYIDATFKQILDRYSVARIIGKSVKAKALDIEKLNFEQAHKVIGFTRFVVDSLRNDYGLDKNKIGRIFPGANILLPDNYENIKISKRLILGNKESPFILGWIGKDWKRKGFDILVRIKDNLKSRGLKIKILCAGTIPLKYLKDKDIEYLGFIDKKVNLQKFIKFVQSCDMGCLFSTAEFSSISILEFIRLGIPVAGYLVDGMKDLFPAESSLTFNLSDKDEFISDCFENYILNVQKQILYFNNASNWSELVTWDRCVREWKQLIDKGFINNSIQPWS